MRGGLGDLLSQWLRHFRDSEQFFVNYSSNLVFPHLRTRRTRKLRVSVPLAIAANVTDTLCSFAELFGQASVL
jgi:hypothetical protein